jgi:hypothetical protein
LRADRHENRRANDTTARVQRSAAGG